MSKRKWPEVPIIVTDAEVDPGGHIGAALVVVQSKARGTGKKGWTKYALAFATAKIPLSIRPGARAVKLMHNVKVWGAATSIATARVKIRALQKMRKKLLHENSS